jgi:hypothetical protein
MKQKTSGMIAFLGMLALAGCYSYQSEAINNASYNEVQATPFYVKVNVGDSDQVLVRLVNAANSGALTSYTVGTVPAGVQVHFNPNFRPVWNSATDSLVPTGDKTAQQYYVVGVTTGTYSFTLTPTSVNTGVSTTVHVVVTPRDLGPALSKITGAPGDTVVITAPVNTSFSQTSAVTFTTGVAAVVARAADSSSITIVVSGGVTGPATVTLVGNKLVPSVPPVTLVSTNTLTTPAQSLGSALSTHNAAAGATVTITAPANYYFDSTAAVSFTTGAISTPVRSADSTKLTFLVGPGITGPATVTNVGLKSAPTLPLTTQMTADSLTTTALTAAPTTLSAATGLIGVPVTVTLSGGLRFLGSTHVLIGGTDAGIQSVSADSSSAVVMPLAGSTGAITFTNVALSFLTSVPLALPSDGKSYTVGATFGGTTDPNAAVFANAPTITLRPAGSVAVTGGTIPSTNASQCGGQTGDGCAVYKVVLTAATTYDIKLIWQGGADMGLYRFKVAASGGVSSGTGFTGNCDTGGQGPTGQPETCTVTALAAGTYYFGVEFFGTGSGYPADANTVPPTWFQFLVTTH